jgi:hypothetical protein
VQQNGIASARVDAAPTHVRSNYTRNPLASEVFNEEVCNLSTVMASSLPSASECPITEPRACY